MGVDITHALELQRRGIEAWMRAMASGTGDAHMFAADGVAAAVVPACPNRSVVNSVVYEDTGSLVAAYGGLAAAYERAGVRAWTVWTPDNDREAIALLRGEGHLFDGEPAAMLLDLDRLPAPDLADLDWDADASPREVGRINDLAYGHHEDGGYEPAIAQTSPGDGVRLYRARVDGEPASVLETVDAGSDCMVAWVATLERFRGRALARRLLHAALAEARDRGLATSTLQASRMGLPIYERLGYQTVCRLHMYERRTR
jgi:GNAT superfamily N-acetyltransferase